MSLPLAGALLDALRPAGDTGPFVSQCAGAPDGLFETLVAEGAVLWLHRQLNAAGTMGRLPATLAEQLRSKAAALEALNLLVDDEAQRVATELEGAGLPFVFIKGCGRRALAARLPLADARSTSDVDILVPEPVARQAWDLLSAAGRVPIAGEFQPRAGHYHLPALLSARRVAVELHVSVSSRVAAPEAWRRNAEWPRHAEWRGRRIPVQTDTELLDGAVTHAASDGTRGYRLRYLLDAAVVMSSGSPDRAAIGARLAAGEYGEPARAGAWLSAAAQLCAGAVAEPPAAGTEPFPIERALAWRLWAASRFASSPSTVGALVEEGTRCEAGLPPREGVPGTGPLLQLRRGVAAHISRAVYGTWRSVMEADLQAAARGRSFPA